MDPIVGSAVGLTLGAEDVGSVVEGLEVGWNEGDMVGLGIGSDEGIILGLEVGADVGVMLGLEVGADVGDVVGLEVGADVGDEVGLEVGADEGDVVGLNVGADVGDVVLLKTGADVGISVGEGDGLLVLVVGLTVGVAVVGDSDGDSVVGWKVYDGRDDGWGVYVGCCV
jgi:hypothetical protein